MISSNTFLHEYIYIAVSLYISKVFWYSDQDVSITNIIQEDACDTTEMSFEKLSCSELGTNVEYIYNSHILIGFR